MYGLQWSPDAGELFHWFLGQRLKKKIKSVRIPAAEK